MRYAIIPLSALLLASGVAVSSARPAPHKAIAQPGARSFCLDNSRYLSHTAYVPSAPLQTPRCGHLLSTDTLLAVRHWDRT